MPLCIDVGAFLCAVDSHHPQIEPRLDLDTGEIVPAVWGALTSGDPGYAEFRAVRDDEERSRRIDPVPSREGWRGTGDFAASVSDAHVQQGLLRAIDGDGAVGRFTRALSSHPRGCP